MVRYAKSDWLIPAGLIALAFIPVVAGMARLVMLASGAPVTADNARFFAEPVPVVLHVLSVTIYCIVGAFQFSPGLRRYHPRWHSIAGRALVPFGLVAAGSGIWMALAYAIVPADNALLHSFRLLAGAGMAASLVLGYVAIRRRNVEMHQAWMRRAYAIGQGAGTQALTQLPVILLSGPLDDMTRALMMGAAWLINLGVAELLIRRRREGRRIAVAEA
ncbi:MAG: DUF2306 domain-containing protein [Bauldia sp.]